MTIWQVAALNQEKQFPNGTFFSEIRTSDCKSYFSYGDYWVNGQGTMWNLKPGDKLTVWTNGGASRQAQQSSIKSVDVDIVYNHNITIYDPNGVYKLNKDQIANEIKSDGQRLFSAAGMVDMVSPFDFSNMSSVQTITMTNWKINYKINSIFEVTYTTDISEIRSNSHVVIVRPAKSFSCGNSSDAIGCFSSGGVSLIAGNSSKAWGVAAIILHEYGHERGLPDAYKKDMKGTISDCMSGNLMGCDWQYSARTILSVEQTTWLVKDMLVNYKIDLKAGGYDNALGSKARDRASKY